ncbi:hypothetical protein ACHQM5_015277 [Ranunculus cassubicifolius]
MMTDNGFPVGLRFNPTGHELIRLLFKKLRNEPIYVISSTDIRDVDLYEKEPWKLYQELNISEYDSIEQKFYFFTYVKNKFGKKGKTMERTVGSGKWTIQNKKEVLDSSGRLVGWKKTLNFQVNRKNLNPSWIMHEYTLLNSDDQDHCLAICRIGRKADKAKLEKEARTCKKRCVSGSVSNHQDFGSMGGKMPVISSGFESKPSSSYQQMSQQSFSICEPSSSSSQSQHAYGFSDELIADNNSAFLEQNLHHQSLKSKLDSDPTTSNSQVLEALGDFEMDEGLGDVYFEVSELLGTSSNLLLGATMQE